MALNFLNFNDSKTEVMVFRPSAARDISSLDLGPLQPFLKPVVTDLGVKLDSDFKFDKQINSVVKSSFYQLRLLAKVKSAVSISDFERLIHAFISTRLDYCNALYAGVSQACLSRLQLVQNAAARLLTGARKYDHISPILASLHWLPVYYRIQFKILMFVFKSLNGLAPLYISELLPPNDSTRALRSTDQSLLKIPQTNLKTRGDRSFSAVAPTLWNKLPPHVRASQTLPVFKSRLKTYLYSMAFGNQD